MVDVEGAAVVTVVVVVVAVVAAEEEEEGEGRGRDGESDKEGLETASAHRQREDAKLAVPDVTETRMPRTKTGARLARKRPRAKRSLLPLLLLRHPHPPRKQRVLLRWPLPPLQVSACGAR